MAKSKNQKKKQPPAKRAPLNVGGGLSAMIQEARENIDRQSATVVEAQKVAPKSVAKTPTPKAALEAAMSQEQIDVALQAISPGTQFRVQYKPDAIEDLKYLQMMLQAGVLKGQPFDLGLILAITLSNSWDNPSNRLFTLTATEKWSEGWIGRFQRAVVSVVIL